MTKIIGIIAEFNPFHNGHKRLLDLAGQDPEAIKVVAMSGNWMQRGEPAFVDKWLRAQMALENGADLVVELPFLTAVNGADYFAQGAVDILHDLGVNQLLFGTENDATDYQRIAQLYAEKAEQMQAYLEELPPLMSYPLKAERMWQHFAGIQFDGNTPNHILGLAYAKAVRNTGISLSTVNRQTSYNATAFSGKIASATAIRKNFADSKNREALKATVPANVWKMLETAPTVSWEDFFSLLRYQITRSADLTDIYQVNEELGHRIQKANKAAENLEDLIERVYTKRYTKGHIRRILTYILLGITKEMQGPDKIHVLGFNQAGQKVLAGARGKVMTKIGQYPWDVASQRADAIYQLAAPEIPEQTHGRKPIILH